jgi:hypothetical protein
MGDVWIKRQADGEWHMWGAQVGQVDGWPMVVALKEGGHHVHWEGGTDLPAFIEEFGEPPAEASIN